MDRTWAQGSGKEFWPLPVLPGLCMYIWTPPRPASLLSSPWRFLVRDASPITWKASWQMPQTEGCPVQALQLLTVLLVFPLLEHSKKFSHIHALLITLCPDCMTAHWMALTSPSLVCWPQISLPPIPPPHNRYSNFSKMRVWLCYTLALATVGPLKILPLGETE